MAAAISIFQRPISIHALREERDLFTEKDIDSMIISIHALREERDRYFQFTTNFIILFQSTRSARSATSIGIQHTEAF